MDGGIGIIEINRGAQNIFHTSKVNTCQIYQYTLRTFHSDVTDLYTLYPINIYIFFNLIDYLMILFFGYELLKRLVN